MDSQTCNHCGGSIKATGSKRKNGNPIPKQWRINEFHSKCYNKIKKDLFLIRLKEYEDKGEDPEYLIFKWKTAGLLHYN